MYDKELIKNPPNFIQFDEVLWLLLPFFVSVPKVKLNALIRFVGGINKILHGCCISQRSCEFSYTTEVLGLEILIKDWTTMHKQLKEDGWITPVELETFYDFAWIWICQGIFSVKRKRMWKYSNTSKFLSIFSLDKSFHISKIQTQPRLSCYSLTIWDPLCLFVGMTWVLLN